MPVVFREFSLATDSSSVVLAADFIKFKFNEATPRGVPGPVFKKTPEMPGFTKIVHAINHHLIMDMD